MARDEERGRGERFADGPVGPRVYVRAPRAADAEAFTRAAVASAELHRGWATPPVTRAAFVDYVERLAGPSTAGFLILRRADDALLGRATLSQIFRGGFENANLGYEAMAGHERRGHMTEGLTLVLAHAFGPLGLHRVEANIQPQNAPSLALARRLGFRHEGFSPRYLQVAGEWRDHERWALLADEFVAPAWPAPGASRTADGG